MTVGVLLMRRLRTEVDTEALPCMGLRDERLGHGLGKRRCGA